MSKWPRPPRRDRTEFKWMLEQASENGWEPYCVDQFETYAGDQITRYSKEEATALCAPCPLLQMCRKEALLEKPAWGVWGGEVWQYGRRDGDLVANAA